MKAARLLLIVTVSILKFTPGMAQDNPISCGLTMEIVGAETRSLMSLFRYFDSEFSSDALTEQGTPLSSRGPIRLLNIVRDSDSGTVRCLEFTKGDLFIVVHPGEGHASASANLKMGLELRMEFESRNGIYRLMTSGTENQGPTEFRLEPNKP